MFIILTLCLALNPNILSSEMFPSGYTVYRKDRHDGYGGVFIACRNTLTSSKLQLNETPSELVACQIQLADHSSLIVCSIYRPHSSNDSHLEKLCNQLSQICSNHPNSALWIAGDANLPDILTGRTPLYLATPIHSDLTIPFRTSFLTMLSLK